MIFGDIISVDDLRSLDAQFAELPLLSQFNNVEAELVPVPEPEPAAEADAHNDSGIMEDESSNDASLNTAAEGTNKRGRSDSETMRAAKRSKGENVNMDNADDGAVAESKADNDSDSEAEDEDMDNEEELDRDHENDDEEDDGGMEVDRDSSPVPLDDAGRPKRQKKTVDKDALDVVKPTTSKSSRNRSSSSRSRRSGGSSRSRGKNRKDDINTANILGPASGGKISRKPKNNDLAVGIDSANLGGGSLDASLSTGHSEYHKIQQLLQKWQRLAVHSGANRITLHPGIVSLIDLWVRLLKLFEGRLKEAHKWFVHYYLL
jgi:hypothetical protein